MRLAAVRGPDVHDEPAGWPASRPRILPLGVREVRGVEEGLYVREVVWREHLGECRVALGKSGPFEEGTGEIAIHASGGLSGEIVRDAG